MIETFGQRLKRMRKEKGFTQAKLSEKTGIYIKQIGNYEVDGSKPNLATLERICKVLGVTATELLGY